MREQLKQLQIRCTKARDLTTQLATLTKVRDRRGAILVAARENLKETHSAVEVAEKEYETITAEFYSVQAMSVAVEEEGMSDAGPDLLSSIQISTLELAAHNFFQIRP